MTKTLLPVADSVSGAKVLTVEDVDDFLRRFRAGLQPPFVALPPDRGLALGLDQR